MAEQKKRHYEAQLQANTAARLVRNPSASAGRPRHTSPLNAPQGADFPKLEIVQRLIEFFKVVEPED
ncbi:MAG: hypothetical protein GYA17_06900 [Chloroflexi bacterium]|jgi:hypothetical protein|nr:hypothetical protein [Anaerolineaceae bacterium]NMB88069.1 hypothetical protein [Chloroflexota bacterium]